jgi:hypothetical protein
MLEGFDTDSKACPTVPAEFVILAELILSYKHHSVK